MHHVHREYPSINSMTLIYCSSNSPLQLLATCSQREGTLVTGNPKWTIRQPIAISKRQLEWYIAALNRASQPQLAEDFRGGGVGPDNDSTKAPEFNLDDVMSDCSSRGFSPSPPARI